MNLIALILLGTLPFSQDEKSEDVQTRVVDFVSDHSNLAIDIRTVEEGLGVVGFDYEYNFTKEFGEPDFANNKRLIWALDISSKGYLATDHGSNPIDSNITSVSWTGQYYEATGTKPLTPKQQMFYRKQVAPIYEKDPDQWNSEEKRLVEEHQMRSQAKNFIAWDVHLKHEATQDLSDHDFAIGAGVAFDLTKVSTSIANLVEYPAGLLRGKEGFVPNPPRVYLGYDFVTDVEHTNREAETGNTDSNLNRLTAQAAWKTALPGDIELRLSYVGYLELNAPSAVRSADRNYVSFLELTFAYPLSEETDLILKYTNGGLPPNFEEDSAFSLGWSLALN